MSNVFLSGREPLVPAGVVLYTVAFDKRDVPHDTNSIEQAIEAETRIEMDKRDIMTQI